MINFTVGPVQSSSYICEIGAEQVPYFRTSEFSKIMFENENYIKEFCGAEQDSRAIFITGSGTAAMEAVVMNVFNVNDRVIVINGGTFGDRFVRLCQLYQVDYIELKLQYGEVLTQEKMDKVEVEGATALVVNIHETSTGVYYDPCILEKFCKKNKLFLVVDAISSFLADDFDMKKMGADIMITGSQKALACAPGISAIVLSKEGVDRVNNSNVKSMYFDLKDALIDGERGQTPFTPAVGILRQINARFKKIKADGGVESEIKRVEKLAHDFRNGIKELPLNVFSQSLSNAVTPLQPLNVSAYSVFEVLKNDYGIWVCPNGGELKDVIFRVGHIGALTIEDNKKLIRALNEMKTRNLL